MSRFMTGLLMGLGIGLLIAPEKGSETRESLAETAGNLKGKFDRLVGRAGAKLDDLKGLLEHEIDGLSDDVRSRIRNILDDESNRTTSSNGSSYKTEFKPI